MSRTATEPKLVADVRQVDSALMIQSESISTLREAVAELERRLSSVLREEYDSPESEDVGESSNGMVGLAIRLTASNNDLFFLHGRIVSLLERLEL